MTAPVVGLTSPSRFINYISNDMFASQGRTGVDVNTLVIGGNEAMQRATLADKIREASQIMDSFLLGTLAATFDTEVGDVTIRPDGCAVIKPRFRPIVALTAFAAGTVSSLTPYTNLSTAAVETERILFPVGPFGTWSTSQGPLQFGPALPVPGSVYARWTTCNGYPVTWLSASAAKDDTTLSVADGSGIVAGQTRLILYTNELRWAFVPTAVSNAVDGLGQPGPAVLNLASPLPLAVTNDPLYPTYVSAMPADVNRACWLITRSLIKDVSGGNITPPTAQNVRNRDPLGARDDLARAYELIDQYQMVQQ